MRDLQKMEARFLRDPLPVRLGNVASNFIRLSTWLRQGHGDAAVADLMRETAWMLEWCGESASEEIVDLQRELCRWLRAWPLEGARSLLAFRMRKMGDRLLEISGLSSVGKNEMAGVSR